MGRWAEDTARRCRAVSPAVGLPIADALDTVAARAVATPAIVVTGPVSSGKSTLVNALVGRRVAPTGAGECTRLTARYVRGPVDRLDVVLADGTRRPLPLAEGGRVPAAVGDRLGVDPTDVDHLLVSLTSEALDGLTVVDTPGTGSARRPRGPARGAADAAEAALVVLPATARPDEVAGLADAARHGPAGVVAVLGRADTVGSEADAAATAGALSGRLAAQVGPVIPVVGLLAETAVTGALRTADLAALRALADDPGTDAALADPELFTSAALPVDPAARSRLLDLLDRRGVGLALALLRERPGAGVGDVCAVLLAASGLDRVVERLRAEVRGRADLLASIAAERRVAALAAAERAALRADRRRDPGGPPRATAGDRDLVLLTDLLEDLRARPLHLDLALVEASARYTGGALALPDDLAADLALLADPPPDLARRLGTTPGELAGHAARRAAAWRGYATWGTPPDRADVAGTVHRGWARLWGELTR